MRADKVIVDGRFAPKKSEKKGSPVVEFGASSLSVGLSNWLDIFIAPFVLL